MKLLDIIDQLSEFLLKNKNIHKVKFYGEKTNIVIEKDKESPKEEKSVLKTIKKLDV